MKLKIPKFPFWGYSLGILCFVLLLKFGFISMDSVGISVTSLEVVLIIYALVLGLVQVTRQGMRLKKLSAIATDLGSGHMGKRSKDLSFDAIGNLAHAINKMADQIQNSFVDLQEAGKNLEQQNDELHKVLKTEARFGAFLESISTVETHDLVKTGLRNFCEISASRKAWLIYFDNDAGDQKNFQFSKDDFQRVPETPFSENMHEVSQAKRWNYVDMRFHDIQQDTTALQIPVQFDGKPLGVVILELDSKLEGRDKRRMGNYIEAFSNALSNCISYQTALRQSVRLESINKELLLADQNRSNFVARMSHELRTPLNSIIGFSKIMEKNKSGNLDELDLDRLEKIHRNGNHLLQMINNILDLSKVEAGEMHVAEELVDIEQLSDDVIDMLQPQADAKNIYLKKEFNESGLSTCTDGMKIRQVLINLVGNAIKFTESGGVKVICSVPQDDPQFLLLEVEDTGIGISAEKHEKIFKAFSQADHSIAQEFGGTGLGLTISRSIVCLLGGTLSLESNPGEGSVFKIKLPLRLKTSSSEINSLLVKKDE